MSRRELTTVSGQIFFSLLIAEFTTCTTLPGVDRVVCINYAEYHLTRAEGKKIQELAAHSNGRARRHHALEPTRLGRA